MSSWARVSGVVLLAVVGVTFVQQQAAQAAQRYGFGSPLSSTEISSWDIDVGPDGTGLPPGRGTADEGEPLFMAQCAGCHGEFGEGVGRFPALLGTPASLVGDRISKTVGGYWPYATTLWDYINRAMPFGNAQSLSPDHVYALTAYILALNNIIDSDTEMNARSLPKVQMPNRHGFITATGSDIHAAPCMKDCTGKVGVVSRAGNSATTPEGE